MIDSVNMFISYSHKDEVLKNQLLEHLSTLRREGLIKVWHDRDVDAGDYWVNSINNQIEISSIILVLVTPSFISSSYCYSVELERALELASAGRAKIIPIILRPADWRNTAFGELQALPTDGKPVTTWANQDEAFLEIAVGLRSAIHSMSRASSNVSADKVEYGPESPGLRFYLYVSDTKVNMLFAQIPDDVKADVSRTLGPRQIDNDADSDRIYKLEVVLKFIRERYQVGSVDEPAEYIAGTHTLDWGCTHGSLHAAADDKPFVFFSGSTENTTFLMSGSSKHLIGDHKPRERGFSSSSIPHVIESLIKDIELERQAVSTIDLRNRIASHEQDSLPQSGEKLAFAIVDQATQHLSSTRQRLDFLAKVLLHGPSPKWEGHNSLLASPLYVALAM